MELNQPIENIDIEISLSRKNFYEFCKFYDSSFFTENKKHLKTICKALQKVYDCLRNGTTYKLGISIAPRWGKSYTISLFAAWILGKFPEGSIMRNSYAATLAEKFSYDVRNIVKSDKFIKVFPSVKLSDDKKSVTGWNLDTAKQVSYFCSGVGGSITGFGCDLLAILDDPIKNWEDAQSETIIEKTWSWYESTHRSRLEKNCCEIHIATRWSNKDIIGKLIEQNFFDEIINIPALNEQGQSNCEEIHTTEYYLNEKINLDESIFESIYQQNPIEIKGLLFPKTELQFFSLSEFDSHQTIGKVAVIDTKNDGDDYFSMPICDVTDNYYYITDVIFNQDGYEFNKENSINKIKELGIRKIKIETNGGGTGFYHEIKRECSDSIVKGEFTVKNKVTRILFSAAIIKQKCKFRNDYKLGSDYDKFMRNLNSYLKNGKVSHDDAPDSLSALVNFIEKQNQINIY